MRQVAALPLGAHLVVAPGDAGPLGILAPVEAAIWSGLAAGLDAAAVAARLAERFAIARPAADLRVAGALDAWRDAGLLTPPAPPARAAAPALLQRIADGAAALAPSRRRVYAPCGRAVAIRFSPPDLESLVHPRLAHAEAAGDRPVATLSVRCQGDRLLLREAGRPAIVETSEAALAGQLVRRIVELSYPSRGWSAVLHAAAVATADGRAMLLPGSNGSGKSILTAALLAAGRGYLSDDCAPIDADGRVAPVPFGLCVKEPGWPVAAPLLSGLAAAPVVVSAHGLPCRFVAPGAPVAAPLPVAGFAFPRYRAGARLAVRRLEPVETLWLLVRHRAWISRRPDRLAGLLSLIERLPAVELDYGDLDDAVAAIDALASE